MATFTVTNTNDTGPGSLRQAIADANALAGEDTVTFDATLSGQTITLTSGELMFSDDLVLDGDLDDDGSPDITVDGGGIIGDPSGPIYLALRISMQGMSINNGSGVRVGQGGRISVVDSIISGNSKPSGGGGLSVYSDGNISVENSIVSGNFSDSGAGGIFADFEDGTIRVINSTVSNNTSRTGCGGISAGESGSILISHSTISGNSTTEGNGGGLCTFLLSRVEIVNSTVSGNSAGGVGGGFYSETSSFFRMFNSTVTNNTALANQGDGLRIGIIDNGQNNPVIISSSIIANNNGSDIDGYFSSAPTGPGNNIIGTGNLAAAFAQPGTLIGITDPGLAPLADNGGPTLTHALLPGSPALDAGANPENLTTDQRGAGFLREVGAAPDIGAFEQQTAQALASIPSLQGGGMLILALLLLASAPIIAKGRLRR